MRNKDLQKAFNRTVNETKEKKENVAAKIEETAEEVKTAIDETKEELKQTADEIAANVEESLKELATDTKGQEETSAEESEPVINEPALDTDELNATLQKIDMIANDGPVVTEEETVKTDEPVLKEVTIPEEIPEIEMPVPASDEGEGAKDEPVQNPEASEPENTSDEVAEDAAAEKTEEIDEIPVIVVEKTEKGKGDDEPAAIAEEAAEAKNKAAESEEAMVADSLPPEEDTAPEGLKTAPEEEEEINATIVSEPEPDVENSSLDALLEGAPVIPSDKDRPDEDEVVIVSEETAPRSPEIGSEDDSANSTNVDEPEKPEDDTLPKDAAESKKGKDEVVEEHIAIDEPVSEENTAEPDTKFEFDDIPETVVLDTPAEDKDDIFAEPEADPAEEELPPVENEGHGFFIRQPDKDSEGELDLSGIPSLEDEEAESSIERLADIAKRAREAEQQHVEDIEDVLGDTDELSVDEINKLMSQMASHSIPVKEVKDTAEQDVAKPAVAAKKPEGVKKSQPKKKKNGFIYFLIVLLAVILAACMLHILGVINLSSILGMLNIG